MLEQLTKQSSVLKQSLVVGVKGRACRNNYRPSVIGIGTMSEKWSVPGVGTGDGRLGDKIINGRLCWTKRSSVLKQSLVVGVNGRPCRNNHWPSVIGIGTMSEQLSVLGVGTGDGRWSETK